MQNIVQIFDIRSSGYKPNILLSKCTLSKHTYVSQWGTVFHENLTLVQMKRHLRGPEVSLLSSQAFSDGPYPQQDVSALDFPLPSSCTGFPTSLSYALPLIIHF